MIDHSSFLTIEDWQVLHQRDVVKAANWLLGKILLTNIKGSITAGRIVETEAYQGPDDRASHAFQNRRTQRTETMFGPAGYSYVYLCYGIHNMFNVVTGPRDTPHAVLIRGIEPLVGTEIMQKRRKMDALEPRLTSGPGSLCQAMGIERSLNNRDLTSSESQIQLLKEESQEVFEIVASPRVGISYAKEWIKTPWRFRIKDNIWCSPAK